MTTRRYRRADLDEVELIAWLLDNSIPIPGTGRRIGIDAIVGFLPGLGDVVSGAVGLLVVARGAALGVPRVVIARMLVNTLLDFLIGSIPLIGDAFDLWFKANARNVALMRAYLADRDRSTAPEWAFFAILAGALVLVAGGVIWLIGAIIGELVRLI
jgi:Domain of unknown function (DUF4112)